jgi:hypothetical protein
MLIGEDQETLRESIKRIFVVVNDIRQEKLGMSFWNERVIQGGCDES